MNEVAPITVHAASLVDKHPTFFSFVFGIHLAIFSQLVRSMSELALLFVGTEAVFYKFFTELALLFVLIFAIVGPIEVRFSQRMGVVSGGFFSVSGGGRLTVLVEAFGVELETGVFFSKLSVDSSHVRGRLIIINKLIGLNKNGF